MGYEPLPIDYKITLKDGTELLFTHQLHLVNQDLSSAFSCENDLQHSIVNGSWSINLQKHDNEAKIKHIVNAGYSRGGFFPPKLGKPYDDEFNLIAPKVKSYQQGQNMIMEAEYLSEKFANMAVVRIFTLSAAGIITHSLRVENRGEKSREIMLHDSCWIGLGDKTTFRCNGQFTQNHDGLNPDGPSYGINDIEPEDIEENWIFEASHTHPKGFCWPPNLKPNFKWGNCVMFEIDAGMLATRQSFETQPVAFVCGVFDNFHDFRNYATQLWQKNEEIPASRVEVKLNDYNPFVTADTIKLEIQNNRETNLAGTIAISSPSEIFAPAEITNEDNEEEFAGNTFALEITKPPATVEIVNISMKMVGYEKNCNRTLFFRSGEITRSKESSAYQENSASQENVSYVVNNGAITFKADPSYGHVCYSLTCNGHEWLTNQYPHHKPFAWWNIFLGGIRVIPSHFNNNAVLKEEISADFAEVNDCYGNTWSGIRTTLTIKEDEELRGAVIESYFVTLPGLPLLCAFYRFVNNTGVYKKDVPEFDIFLKISDSEHGADSNEKTSNDEQCEDLGEKSTDGISYADFKDKSHQKMRLRFGEAESEADFENLVKLTGNRPQNMYFFHANRNNGKGNSVLSDNKVPPAVTAYMEAPAAPGETFTSSPAFLLITDANLPENALDDLERLQFNS